MSDPNRPWAPDPRLSGVASDVLRNRHDRPVSVTSPALEWTAIQLSAITSPFGRALYQWEIEAVNDIYAGSVDASRIRVVEARILNAPTTLGNQIRVPPGFSFDTDEHKPILIHEAGHVWQYQTRGTNYITCSVYHNASGQIGTGDRNVAYMNYRLHPNARISEYTAEEQATIIGDYYEITRRYAGVENPPDWVRHRSPDLAIYEDLIRQVRAAIPRAETQIYQDSLMNVPRDNMPPSPATEGMAPVMPLLQVRFRGL